MILYNSKITRKYPLRGYFLGVLTHTTAWDRLWGGDVFLRLYIRSSASPRVAAVGLGCWNCEHVILRVAIRINIRIYDHDETWKCDRMQVAGCRLALPCPAQQCTTVYQVDIYKFFNESFFSFKGICTLLCKSLGALILI